MASRREDTDPATVGDIRKLLKRIKTLEDRVGDAFEAIATGDDSQKEFWDEHEDKIARLQRSVNRLKDHTHEEVEDEVPDS